APVAAAAAYAPGGFRLEASNGYWVHAIAFDGDPRGQHDGIVLFVGRKGSGAVYFARKGVQVTETTVSAELGKLGSIDLHFVPSGKPRLEGSACDSPPVEIESGFYEGRFDFRGEQGYTEAHSTRARGEARLQISLVCGGGGLSEGIGGHSPGAQLTMQRRLHVGRLRFEATKNSPTRPSRFGASIEERREGLEIERGVEASAGPGAFDFDVPNQSARLKPPKPFTGSARFERKKGQMGRLKGSLVVDFPGRSNVSLSGVRGSLQRWVQNPSHPFRPAARLFRSRS
ncbi:MAG TPA: hypothetical protein VFP17_06330, partial [Solirubrobacterales bacterium]|nr:hypothetical protein [Solirubrobacterales bacterium]